MRCRTAQRRISDGIDGALGSGRRVRLEAHLMDCPDCRAYRDRLARLQGEIRPAEEPPEGYWAGLERRIEARLDREEGGRSPVGMPFPARRRMAWAAACLFVAAGTALWFALLRPKTVLTAVWIPETDPLMPLLLEAEADPELEKAVEGEIRDSIAELAPALDADAAALAASDPLFWGGLSDEDLGVIADWMEKEAGRGGQK